ncbi:MAG TPA: hypothetical protein VN030_13590, partial [Cellvibrio sp.]|nr:hypothetical protein [Cellvibrio sp.]
SWLDSGVLRFVKDTTSAENKTFYFLKSSFTIKRSCSPKRNDFLSLATKNIKGKFAEARMLDPDKETRKWAIPDPEEYWERVIELTENDELLVIDVSRIYRPEGDN